MQNDVARHIPHVLPRAEGVGRTPCNLKDQGIKGIFERLRNANLVITWLS